MLFFERMGRDRLGFGRNLVEIPPTSLPELPIWLRDLRNIQNSSKNNFSFSILIPNKSVIFPYIPFLGVQDPQDLPRRPPGPILDRRPKSRKLRNRQHQIETTSTMFTRNPRSTQSLAQIESHFATVEPQRVAAVVARSALQSAAPGPKAS